MQEMPYLVTRAEGLWTIRFRGRACDRFVDKNDAVLTAIIRAERARRQGKRAKVLVEENGRARAVWSDEPTARTEAEPSSRRSSRGAGAV